MQAFPCFTAACYFIDNPVVPSEKFKISRRKFWNIRSVLKNEFYFVFSGGADPRLQAC